MFRTIYFLLSLLPKAYDTRQHIYQMWLTAVSTWRRTSHMLVFMPEYGANINHIKTRLWKHCETDISWNRFAFSYRKPSVLYTLKGRCPFNFNCRPALYIISSRQLQTTPSVKLWRHPQFLDEWKVFFSWRDSSWDVQYDHIYGHHE